MPGDNVIPAPGRIMVWTNHALQRFAERTPAMTTSARRWLERIAEKADVKPTPFTWGKGKRSITVVCSKCAQTNKTVVITVY